MVIGTFFHIQFAYITIRANNMIREETKCSTCGEEFGDHLAKEPHMNMKGMPLCGGFVSIRGKADKRLLTGYEKIHVYDNRETMLHDLKSN